MTLSGVRSSGGGKVALALSARPKKVDGKHREKAGGMSSRNVDGDNYLNEHSHLGKV